LRKGSSEPVSNTQAQLKDFSYGRISKVAFGDSLKERGFSNVGQTDLKLLAFWRDQQQSSVQFHSSSYYRACPAGSSPPLPLSWEASSSLRRFV
jgi:hypothetical protein